MACHDTATFLDDDSDEGGTNNTTTTNSNASIDATNHGQADEREKGREKGVHTKKTRRQSIVISSLLSFRGKNPFSEAKDAKSAVLSGSISTNPNKKEESFVSSFATPTATPKKSRRYSMNDVPRLSLDFATKFSFTKAAQESPVVAPVPVLASASASATVPLPASVVMAGSKSKNKSKGKNKDKKSDAEKSQQSASTPAKPTGSIGLGNKSQHHHHQQDVDDNDNINCSSVGLLRSALGSSGNSKKQASTAAHGVTTHHTTTLPYRHTHHQATDHQATGQAAALQALQHAPRPTNPAVTHRLNCGCCSNVKPIFLFRGGEQWNELDVQQDSVYLDLFWPIMTDTMKKELEKDKGKGTEKGKENNKENDRVDENIDPKEKKEDKAKGKAKEAYSSFDDDENNDNGSDASDDNDDDILPLEAMKPLCNFRNLRFLKLTGMSQSYQKYIWQAVWLNPGFEELELEMTLEPCIRRAFSSWPSIKGNWVQRDKPDTTRSSYYGDNGQGILHRRIGIGEYLDKYAIAQARTRAVALVTSSPTSTSASIPILLPIVKLSLTGFVVDADPFRLFNPHRLRLLTFKNDCVDAGFALPESMHEQVVVSWPRLVTGQGAHGQQGQAVLARRVRPGEVKLIDLGSKKKPAEAKTVGAAGTGLGAGVKASERVTPNFSRGPYASPGRQGPAPNKGKVPVQE
ncbi:hypothetical protein AJ79_06119 [Helicocarpus griseus UAMH5409]|uniref:Uncharacterized protein n=1 Tax=Helicocarpus griseus UAMH5409 TaxID=1447875 RepID=A0A2B7XGL1_9EURO|nr:hypothetical protein AJ79_06119 [Helicocarpus griseus UAMH5409]